MKRRSPLPFQLTAASILVLAASGVLAQQAGETAEAEEAAPYTPLGLENRPQAPRRHTDHAGSVQVGAAYANDDSYMFGQYNGLNEDEATLIGNLQWQSFNAAERYWQVSLSDMGLDTREGQVTWGRPDRLRIELGFDSQQQVRNDSGKTPFRGSQNQQLPGDGWKRTTSTEDAYGVQGRQAQDQAEAIPLSRIL